MLTAFENLDAATDPVVAQFAGESRLCPEVHRLESTVRYLGVEVEDALEISEQTEV